MEDLNLLWHLIEQGRKGENKGLSVGLPKLDKIIGGIQPSRYYCISGASSAGKTALVLYFIYRLFKDYPKEPIYLVYFSLEIGSEVLLAKLMALYCAEEFGVYLTINDILSFDSILSDSDYQYLKKARDWIATLGSRLIILDKGLNARILYKEICELMKKLGSIENVGNKEVYVPKHPRQRVIGVIDHMSLIRPEEGRTLKAEIDLTSSFMVTLKRKFYLSWMALMQQNRASSSMDRRKAELNEPGLNDVKDSGGPVQDSDVVLQLYYPARDKIPTYREYKILGPHSLAGRFRSIIVSKNRYGIADRVIGCGFYGEVGWFKELPLGRDITDFTKYLDINANIRGIDTTVVGTVEIDKNNIIYSLS